MCGKLRQYCIRTIHCDIETDEENDLAGESDYDEMIKFQIIYNITMFFEIICFTCDVIRLFIKQNQIQSSFS